MSIGAAYGVTERRIRVSVSYASPTAVASTQRVSASAAVVQSSKSASLTKLAAVVQHVIPAAALQHVFIVLNVVLDPIGRNPVLFEISVVADTTTLGVGKRFYEVQGTSETRFMLFQKGRVETLLTTEARSFALSKSFAELLDATDDFQGNANIDDDQVMVLSKTLSVEQQTVSDSASVTAGKLFTESKTVTDQIDSVAFAKALTEDKVTSETKSFDIFKALTDMVDAGDEFNAVALTDDGEVMVFGKTLADSVAQTDAVSLQPEKGTTDQNSTADQIDYIDFGKGLTDNPLTSESKQFDVAKPLSDASTLADVRLVSAGKTIADRVYYPADGPNQYDTYSPTYFASDYVREGFPAISFGKGLSDSVQTTDDFYGAANADDDETMVFGKVLGEVATTGDSKVFAASKALADTSTSSDVRTSSLSKPVTDTVSKSDVATKGAGKSLLDGSITSDIVVRAAGKGVADSAATADNKAFALSKSLLDSVYSTDDFLGVANADDDETMAFGKAVSDSFTKSDVANLTPGKGLTESVSKSDSGSLVWTDYWDINYTVTTSGVYVGNSQTF